MSLYFKESGHGGDRRRRSQPCHLTLFWVRALLDCFCDAAGSTSSDLRSMKLRGLRFGCGESCPQSFIWLEQVEERAGLHRSHISGESYGSLVR